MKCQRKNWNVIKVFMRCGLSGSVTIFLAYVLVFVLALVFVLLEVSRVWGLEQRTKTDTIMTGNSLMAEYTIDLWEEYGLLFLDGSYGTDEFQLSYVEQRGLGFSSDNVDVHGGISGQIEVPSWNLFGLQTKQVDITSYGLATDQGGRAFCQEAVHAVEGQFSEELVSLLYQQMIEKQESDLPVVEVNETDTQLVLSENPMDVVDGMKQSGALKYVTTGVVSNKQIDLDNILENRSLMEGNCYEQESAMGWREKILFRQYLGQYFTTYIDSGKDHGLDYEIEYLIAGRASDKENLRVIVNRLLAMRELANLQYLQTDVKKQELALAAATGLAAATLSPELVPVYKKAIMAAWAYAESVSDVKLLLDGQKVELIKTASQWHTELTELGRQTKKIEQKQGLTYEQYLQLFLWTMKERTLSYRAMNLIEVNTGCNMNYQIYCLNGQIEYAAEPLFSSCVAIGHGKPQKYEMQQDFGISYIDK